MKRHFPEKILRLLECWLSRCYSCVKWFGNWSSVFHVDFGVRQGSVLAPFLFAVYLDDVAKFDCINQGCFIILYADDILLISPSVCKLENLLHSCERELQSLDMSINFKKSGCLRIGSRYNAPCTNILSSNGIAIPWIAELRYLGVTLQQSHAFRCSLVQAKNLFIVQLMLFSVTLDVLHQKR